MQDNEFEKQFKKLMGDFDFSPSDAAWKKINYELQQKRRRKTPLIFLLIAGMLVSGVLVTNHLKHTKLVADNSVATLKTLADSNVVNNIKTDHKIKEIVKPDLNTTTLKKGGAKDEIHLGWSNNSTATLSNAKTNKVEEKKYSNNKNDFTDENNLIQNGNNNTFSEPVHNADSTSNYINNKPIAALTDSNLDTVSLKMENNITHDLKKDTAITATQQQIKTSIAAKNKFPKWQFGLTANAGKSSAVAGWFNENKILASSYVNSPGLPISIDSVAANKIYKASTAYQFNLIVQRRIIRNGFLSTGIGFIHLSTKTMVGDNIDSVMSVQDPNIYFTVQGFYKPGTSSYTNNYNFIELPVFFQQDLRLKKNLSFSYNAGFSLRQLVSSKSLFYNAGSNNYFSKETLLNKTQVQVTAGAALKINAGKTASIYIGPQLSYSLSGFSKNVYTTDFHFINYGLQAGLLLHKQ